MKQETRAGIKRQVKTGGSPMNNDEYSMEESVFDLGSVVTRGENTKCLCECPRLL